MWQVYNATVSSDPSHPMALTVGDRLGHYDVTALIGDREMGQVHRATDAQVGRNVALTTPLGHGRGGLLRVAAAAGNDSGG